MRKKEKLEWGELDENSNKNNLYTKYKALNRNVWKFVVRLFTKSNKINREQVRAKHCYI